MKEDKTKRLIKKYKEGNSTLNEEQFLFDNATNSQPSMELWSTFVKNNKTETPKGFNAQLWESFDNKTTKKRQLTLGLMSAAASVVLLISLLFIQSKQKELDYAEKEALLSLAKEMVSNSDSVGIEQNIIYEDEIVIIYTTKE